MQSLANVHIIPLDFAFSCMHRCWGFAKAQRSAWAHQRTMRNGKLSGKYQAPNCDSFFFCLNSHVLQANIIRRRLIIFAYAVRWLGTRLHKAPFPEGKWIHIKLLLPSEHLIDFDTKFSRHRSFQFDMLPAKFRPDLWTISSAYNEFPLCIIDRT